MAALSTYQQKLIDVARSYVGTTEPSGDDQFIQAFNKIAGSNLPMDTPWCAIFVTFAARTAGIPTTMIPTFSRCVDGIEWFKSKNLWHDRQNYQPQPGDIIFYDWNYDTTTDHVGIVVSTNGTRVITIEGNCKSSHDAYGVWEKNVQMTSSYILGYGSPAYDRRVSVALSTTLSPIMKKSRVAQFQKWLNQNFSSELNVDGLYGPKTLTAAIKAWQTDMRAVYCVALVPTGVFDSISKSTANKYLLRKGSPNKNQIRILQGMLYSRGYEAGGFDGGFGDGCYAAVQAFQKAKRLEVDGIVGSDTWTALFKL